MPMLEPKELEERRHKRIKSQKRKKRSFGLLPFIIVVLAIYSAVVSVMPLATLQIQTEPLTLATKPKSTLPWPAYGQSALGAVGYGMLAQNGDQKPIPIASVAKIVTALAVLKERPMNEGQPMPMLTITTEDVTTYERYLEQGQSVVAVEAGEQLSQYQALQALLLPSANNMAEILAKWAFGSVDGYLQFVNPFTKTLGMSNTNIADASGFSPDTVSTAVDLVKLAEIAMNHPVIAEIVNQPEAELPVAGKVYNVNKLLGHDGIVGIKTGNTDQAGGCFMFSARRAVDGDHKVTLVGVVMGAQDRTTAISDSLPLIDEAFKLFRKIDVVHNSQIIGKITQPGGVSTAVIANHPLAVVTWDNQTPVVEISTQNLGSSVKQGEEIGHLDIRAGDMVYSVPLVASQTIKPPSYAWRIRHAAGYL